MSDRLIVALDFTSLTPAIRMAKQLRGFVRTVKVGSALFTAVGPQAISILRSLGFEVMLDLKFHDIPSTVELSCRAATRHRVAWLTVHGIGAPAMLEAAVHGVRQEAQRLRIPRPRVLAVTILTSVAHGTATAVASTVTRLAAQALQSGCDGVVASAQEAKILRARFGTRLQIVCPGIRPSSSNHGDQQRVCTPQEALRSGADRLVIGRPITGAPDPRTATQRILTEMEGGASC